jgi:hypothetical protein
MVVHMRAGTHTACGIPLCGAECPADAVAWADILVGVDCPECVLTVLPLTILPPEYGFRLT